MSGGCYKLIMCRTQKCSRIQPNKLSFTNATVVLLGEKMLKYIISHLIHAIKSIREVLLKFPFYRVGNRGTGRETSLYVCVMYVCIYLCIGIFIIAKYRISETKYHYPFLTILLQSLFTFLYISF